MVLLYHSNQLEKYWTYGIHTSNGQRDLQDMKKIFIRIFSVKISDSRLHSFTQPGRFYTKDALSVWTNFGKRFVIRLVMCF